MYNKDTPKFETCVACVGRVSTRHGRLKSTLQHAILVGCGRCFTLTTMYNKDTPKFETCVACVGRVSTRHGRLKSTLQHAILVGCGRCFTLTTMYNKDTPKFETCVACVGRVSTRHGRLKSALQHAILVGCGRCFTLISTRLRLRLARMCICPSAMSPQRQLKAASPHTTDHRGKCCCVQRTMSYTPMAPA